MSDCLFCQIVQRQLPAKIIEEDDELLAINDVHPQAPTHLLLIPKSHIATLSELTSDTARIMANAVVMANRLATRAGVAEQGYRLVVNCGSQAGQSVWHLHVHLLGGRQMGWPPG